MTHWCRADGKVCGNLNFEQLPNLRPPNTEGDRALAAHLAISFIRFGQGGSKNMRARPALWSTGFPETFLATGSSFPAADRLGDGNKQRRLSLSLSRSAEGRIRLNGLKFVSMRTCSLPPAIRRGHILEFSAGMSLECVRKCGTAWCEGRGKKKTQQGTF